MHLLSVANLMLVIFACSVGALIEFVTRPLRIPFSGEPDNGCEHRFPFARLLDSSDFHFLESAGFSSQRVRRFRARRRSIARLWLRALAADFNQVRHALLMILMAAQVDRPDLSSGVARQQVFFCCHFLRAEVQLAVNACGLCPRPPLASLAKLETLCTGLRVFTATVQRACSA